MATKQATQAETARDVVMHIARIQLASITAASKFFAGWAQSADRYVQPVNGEAPCPSPGRHRVDRAGLPSCSGQHRAPS